MINMYIYIHMFLIHMYRYLFIYLYIMIYDISLMSSLLFTSLKKATLFFVIGNALDAVAQLYQHHGSLY